MKTNTKIVALVVLVALFCASFCSVNAFAATKKTTTSDNFDKSDYVGTVDPAMWSTSATTIKTEEVIASTYALKLGSEGGREVEAALVSKNTLTNLKSVIFDVKTSSPNWFHIGFPQTREAMTTANGEFNPYRRPLLENCSIFKQNEWQTVKIDVLSANTFNLYITDKGKEFPTTPYKDELYTLAAGDSFASCYFELELNTSENIDSDPHMYVDNFVFELADGTKLEDNFEDGTMNNLESIGATVVKDGVEKVYSPDHTIEFVDGSYKLAFDSSKKGDFLMMTKKIEKNDKFMKGGDPVLNVSFDMNFDAAASDADSVGYFFAMASAVSAPLSGSWCFNITKNGGSIEKYNADGTKETLTDNTCTFADLTSDGGSVIQLKLTADGTLYVYEKGTLKMQFGGIDAYEGFTGLVAATDNTSKIYVDNVVVNEYSFEKVKTKSVSSNFSNNYFGPEGKEDLVSYADSGTIEVRDGELVFERCSDGSYFGSAYQYDNFVAEFKMTSIYGGWQKGMPTDERMAANRWIGFDFGRKSATIRNYGTYGMVGIRVTHPTVDFDDNKKLVNNWKTAETFLHKAAGTSEMSNEIVTTVKEVPASYFQDITYDGAETQRADISADAAVCFKFVGQDNKLSMYMKRADEGDYTLYLTVDNIEISGYLAIMCTGYAYCTFDDFSITNTAEIYDLADTEVPKQEGGTTKTEIVYDRAGVDVNWQEELDLNKGAANGGSNVVAIVAIVVLAVAVAALTVLLVLTKKKRA